MNTKHTPGPWHVSDSGFEVRCSDKVGAFNITVAACYAPVLPEVERKANARLIAAAPELLATLKQVHAMLSQPVQFTGSETGQAAQILRGDAGIARGVIEAAIAKAGGDK